VTRNEMHARILQTAWDLVVRDGLSVSMEHVASAVGISRQALYLYVQSRAGLFTQMARYRDEVSGIAGRFQRAVAAPTAEQALEDTIATWFAYVAEILPVARALMTGAPTDDTAAAAWWDRMDASTAVIGRVVDRLEDEEVLDPTWGREVAVQMLWALTHVQVYDDLVNHHAWSHDEAVARVTVAARRTLLRLPTATKAPEGPGHRMVRGSG
jgi:AcrR family transcriptional regulator